LGNCAHHFYKFIQQPRSDWGDQTDGKEPQQEGEGDESSKAQRSALDSLRRVAKEARPQPSPSEEENRGRDAEPPSRAVAQT
jgi:hypothetical protein